MYVKGCETVPQSGRTNQLALPSPGVILAFHSLPLSRFSPPPPPQAALLWCLSTKVTLHWLDFESQKTTTQPLLFNLTAFNEQSYSEIPVSSHGPSLFFLPSRGLLWDGGTHGSLDSGQASCFWAGHRKTGMGICMYTQPLFSCSDVGGRVARSHWGVFNFLKCVPSVPRGFMPCVLSNGRQLWIIPSAPAQEVAQQPSCPGKGYWLLQGYSFAFCNRKTK